MKNLFVPYNIALALKELGFNEPCLGEYLLGDFFMLYTQGQGLSRDCLAPLYQQVVDFLREKYEIHISIASMAFGYVGQHNNTPDPATWGKDKRWDSAPYKDYYEAYDAVINEALNLLEQ